MKLSLIGFMGSGKSTVGQCLAQLLSLRYYEMDQMIQSESGRESIPEIFQVDGEVRFRELEIAAAKRLSQIVAGIISCGGGVIQNKINLDYLKMQHGKVIYLHADFPEITERIDREGRHTRPLFQNTHEAHELYRFREPLYRAYADITIDTKDKKPEDIAREIVQKVMNQNH